jgi:hypothetical protein
MDLDVTARTIISGLVNGQTIKGNVSAALNTAGGGRSRCEFSRLPLNFTPATLGTHT